MNCRYAIGLSIAALGIALLSPRAIGQQQSLRGQLVGSWYLVASVATLPDGSKQQLYDANPKGINMFGADGRFVVLNTRGDLPRIATSDREKATADEARAIVAGSIGYFGTYTVDEFTKVITYRTEGTTYMNLPAVQRRVITVLTANELRYRNPTATSGGSIEVILKRAE